jgi:hypothetical protein
MINFNLMLGLVAATGLSVSACRTGQQVEEGNSDLMSTDDPCVGRANDPYEPRLRFLKGITTKGKCIDASYRRSIVLLDDPKADLPDTQLGDPNVELPDTQLGDPNVELPDTQLGDPNVELPDTVKFANLYHMKNFYIAEVDTTAISEVILQLEHFVRNSLNAGAHAQLRLRFSKPVKITAQYDLAQTPVVEEVNQLILSYEGLGSESTGKFDLSPLIQAFDRSSVGIYRITTMNEYIDTFVKSTGNRVEQWKVDLSQEKKMELFKEWAQTSNKKGMLSPYQLFDSNCINQVLNAMDKLNKGFWQDFRENITKPFNWYPGFIAQAAQAHGIKLTKMEDLGPADASAKSFFK